MEFHSRPTFQKFFLVLNKEEIQVFTCMNHHYYTSEYLSIQPRTYLLNNLLTIIHQHLVPYLHLFTPLPTSIVGEQFYYNNTSIRSIQILSFTGYFLCNWDMGFWNIMIGFSKLSFNLLDYTITLPTLWVRSTWFHSQNLLESLLMFSPLAPHQNQ